MDDFSWSDSIKAAFAPCLSCLQSTPDQTSTTQQSRNPTPRAELEGLLADVEDYEAETLSLHSNIGDTRRKKKKRGPSKNITIFGYNVFGKPPIRLEGEDTLNGDVQSGPSSRKPTISTSTLDSDAAPLDASTIDDLSVRQLNETLAAEEEARRQKEERRRKRRERKDLKQASLAQAMNREQEEFEGFPGSVVATYTNGPKSVRSNDREVRADHLDADEEGADFEARMYTARIGGKSSRTGSDSLSRTSDSLSNPDQTYDHHYTLQQPGPIPPPDHRAGRLVGEFPRSSRKSKASSKSSSSKTSQSSSLLSPVTPLFPTLPTIVPQDQGEFEGFPNDGAFPSVGFGGGKVRRGNGDMGVALARRGND